MVGAHAACGLRPEGYADLPKAKKAEYLRFNDVRGAAVTLLAEAEHGIPQICAVTGHTLQSATRVLEKYLTMTPGYPRPLSWHSRTVRQRLLQTTASPEKEAF